MEYFLLTLRRGALVCAGLTAAAGLAVGGALAGAAIAGPSGTVIGYAVGVFVCIVVLTSGLFTLVHAAVEHDGDA